MIHGDGCAVVETVGPELPEDAATNTPALAACMNATSTGSTTLVVVPEME